MNRLTDEDLIARCARGDRDAMDVLVSRHHAKLLDFLYRHTGDRERAADVAQRTLVKVFEAAGSYGMRSSFRTWMYAVALNLARDEYRRTVRRRESLESELPDDVGLEAAGVLSGRVDREASIDLWSAVECLREEHRIAVLLKFRQELTYEEIAEVMDVPSGTVKSWIHHALKSLRETLGAVKCEG